MDIVINIASLVVLVLLGYMAGTIIEVRHYRSIREREDQTLNMPASTFMKTLPDPEGIESSLLLIGSAVISIDYFKRFMAGIINLFGGQVTPYMTLVDRARREALLRMKEQALAQGCQAVVNIRIETTPIGRTNGGNRRVGCVEVLAYGTGLRFA